MITFALVAMRESMMLVTLLIAVAARRHATVECGLLTVLGFYAALKVTAPSLLVGWP